MMGQVKYRVVFDEGEIDVAEVDCYGIDRAHARSCGLL